MFDILAVGFLFGLLIFLHEGGHFLAARWAGVAVTCFSIGMGPKLFSWTSRRGTEWRLSALPFGGYVKMRQRGTAETPEEFTTKPAPDGLHYEDVSRAHRAVILAAGPFVNVALAFLIYFALTFTQATDVTPAVIAAVAPDGAAATAGVQPGDRVLAVNGTSIDRFRQLGLYAQSGLAAPMTLYIARGDARLEINLTPRVVTDLNPDGRRVERGVIGVQGNEPIYATRNFSEASHTAFSMLRDNSTVMLRQIGQILTRERSTDNVGGVVNIAQAAAKNTDTLISYLMIMAMISLNLGLFNLLPVPALDGGQLVVLAVEAVARRPLPKKIANGVTAAGVVLVLCLFAFTTVNDLRFVF